MSSPKYRYGTADAEDTDYFIAKVTGSSDATNAKKKQDAEVSINQPKVIVDARDIPPTTGQKCAAVFLGLVSILVFGSAGAAGVFIVIRESPLESLWPMAFYGAIGICAAGVLAGLCGFFGACCKNNALKALFMIFIIIFAVGCVAGGAVAGLYDSSNLHISQNWENLVAKDPATACQFQKNYECTGWTEACAAAPDASSSAHGHIRAFGVMGSDSIPDSGTASGSGAVPTGSPTTLAPLPPTPAPTTTVIPTNPPPTPTTTPIPTGDCPVCAPALTYTASCSSQFHHTLSNHVLIGLGVAAGLALLSIISAIAAYKSRTVTIYDSENEYL
jgi:hypothetical protein